MIESSRRGFITGLVSFVAAPAIVRAANIMPVREIKLSAIDIVNRSLERIMIDLGPEMDKIWLDQSIYGMSAWQALSVEPYIKRIPLYGPDGWADLHAAIGR